MVKHAVFHRHNKNFSKHYPGCLERHKASCCLRMTWTNRIAPETEEKNDRNRV